MKRLQESDGAVLTKPRYLYHRLAHPHRRQVEKSLRHQMPSHRGW